MAIINSALQKIKSDVLAPLGGASRVNQVFADTGHAWRDRVLDPATTTSMFIQQVLNANTAISHLQHITGVAVSDSSYCAARAKLPVEGVAKIVTELCDGYNQIGQDSGRWRGHRVVIADGTGTIAPDVPAMQAMWPQNEAQKPGCGFPAIKLLAIMHAHTGMIQHASIMPLRVQEFSQLTAVSGILREGDILLADRGFCSYSILADLAKRSVFPVIRMHQKVRVDFTPGRAHQAVLPKGRRTGKPISRFVKSLGKDDQIVEWQKPKTRPTWMSQEDFAKQPLTMLVREMRFKIEEPGMRTTEITLVTALLDPVRYPKRKIAKLFRKRWEIELNFRHLKITLKMDHLKCKTTDGITKEIMIYILVYNMVRAVMLLAQANQNEDDPNRISFKDAWRWLCAKLASRPAEELPRLKVNQIRPGRMYPRQIKKRPKAYDYKNTKPEIMVEAPALQAKYA